MHLPSATPGERQGRIDFVRNLNKLRWRRSVLELMTCFLAMIDAISLAHPLWLWRTHVILTLPPTTYAYGGIYSILRIPGIVTACPITVTRIPDLHYFAAILRLINTLSLCWIVWCLVYMTSITGSSQDAINVSLGRSQAVSLAINMCLLISQTTLAWYHTQYPPHLLQ